MRHPSEPAPRRTDSLLGPRPVRQPVAKWLRLLIIKTRSRPHNLNRDPFRIYDVKSGIQVVFRI